MTAVSAGVRRPFKALDPYTRADRDIFFGRQREVGELYRLFFERPVTLVYGQSGSGKTSLIQCGLFSEVDVAELAVIPIRLAVQPLMSIRTALRDHGGDGSDDVVVLAQSAAQQSSKTIALFFDQFEEVFLLHDDRTRSELADELRRLVDARLDLRIIAAAREEYLGRITEIETIVPELMAGRYRVARMSSAQAEEAIASACARCKVELQPGILATVFHDLAGSAGDPIELPLVQVVMDRLYEKAVEESPSHPVLTASALEAAGGTRNVLARFLAHQVEQTPDQSLARSILKLMVTAEGTKRLVVARSIEAQIPDAGPDDVVAVMRHLVTARVLRTMEVAGEEWFELRHDALAAEVDRWLSAADRELIALRTIVESRYQHYATRGILLDANTLREVEPFEEALSAIPEHRDFIRLSRAEIERLTLFNEINQAVMMAYMGARDGQETLFVPIVRRAFAIQDSRNPDWAELFETLREFIRLRERAHATRPTDPGATVAGEPDLSMRIGRIFGTSHRDFVGDVSSHFISLLVFPDAGFLSRWLRMLVFTHIPPALAHLGRPADVVLSSAAEVMAAIVAMERGDVEDARRCWASARVAEQPFAPDLHPGRLAERFEQMTERYIKGEDRRLNRDESLALLRRIAYVVRLTAATDAPPSADVVVDILNALNERKLFSDADAFLSDVGEVLGPGAVLQRLDILGRAGDPDSIAAGQAILESLRGSEQEGEACYQFALALQAAQRFSEAIVVLDRALVLGHKPAGVRHALGFSCSSLGDRATAAKHYVEAFRLAHAPKFLVWSAEGMGHSDPAEGVRFLASLERELGDTAGWKIAMAAQYAYRDAPAKARGMLRNIDVEALSSTDLWYVVDTLIACDALDEAEAAMKGRDVFGATFLRYRLAALRWKFDAMKEQIQALHKQRSSYPYYYLLEYLYVGGEARAGQAESASAWRHAVEKNVALDGPGSGFGEHLLAYLLGLRTLEQLEEEAAGSANPADAWCELHFYVGAREWKESHRSPVQRFQKVLATNLRAFTEYELARMFLRGSHKYDRLPHVNVSIPAAPPRVSAAHASLRQALRDELVGRVRDGTMDGDHAKRLAERSVDFLEAAENLPDLRRGIALLAREETTLRVVENRFYREFGSPHLVLERLVSAALSRDDWPLAQRVLAESDGFSGDIEAILPELPPEDRLLANTLLRSDL